MISPLYLEVPHKRGWLTATSDEKSNCYSTQSLSSKQMDLCQHPHALSMYRFGMVNQPMHLACIGLGW